MITKCASIGANSFADATHASSSAKVERNQSNHVAHFARFRASSRMVSAEQADVKTGALRTKTSRQEAGVRRTMAEKQSTGRIAYDGTSTTFDCRRFEI